MESWKIEINGLKCPRCKALRGALPIDLAWNQHVQQFRQAVDVKCDQCGEISVCVVEVNPQGMGSVYSTAV